MQIQEMPITAIREYKNNPRNNDGAVEAVAASIREFGFKVPIVIDTNGVIVAGHTRLKAAKKLCMDSVPCIVADDLNESQIQAFRLADNKVSEFAEWDFAKMEAELAALADVGFDMDQFGFDFGDADDETEFVEDDAPEVDEESEPTVKRGEIWKLGRHTLMCGDSTNIEMVRQLTDGRKIDVCFTSPPYGFANSAKIRNHYVPGAEGISSLYDEHNDDADEWLDLMQMFYECAREITQAQFINVQMLGDNKKSMIEFMNRYKDDFVDVIVWDKGAGIPHIQKNVLNSAFEFVLIYDKENPSKTIRFGDFKGTQDNIVRVGRGHNEFADVHRAVFPVDFAIQILNINANAKTVYEPFAGTGTTLIACEHIGKQSYCMELSPAYCDVIIKRWETLTGETAVRLA